MYVELTQGEQPVEALLHSAIFVFKGFSCEGILLCRFRVTKTVAPPFVFLKGKFQNRRRLISYSTLLRHHQRTYRAIGIGNFFLSEALMIAQVFPKDFPQYLSLPVLGPLMDSYTTWLHEHQYTHRSTQYELRMAAHVCEFLESRRLVKVEDVGEQDLNTCYLLFCRKFPNEAGSVRVLTRFLREHGFIQACAAPEPSRTDIHLNAFEAHLRDARGYAPSTVTRQVQFAGEFLKWLKFESAPQRLASLCQKDVEGFVIMLGKRMGRVGLQKPIASIRNFLRFLASDGVVAPGLDSRIDTPRVYRQEKLPCSLPWKTVQAFLSSIDRDTAMGMRDYAIFSLMATYGLRACDIVALKLDDIQWRSRCIRICQSKTDNPLELPLTDEVGATLYEYLKKVPRYGKHREIFLRMRAPGGSLKSTAVTSAFQTWSKKSGLDIPFKGAKCLRHSYAIHLLRQGISVKTIGAILGHRSPESTEVYLRLSIDDLRDVALPMPAASEGDEGAQS